MLYSWEFSVICLANRVFWDIIRVFWIINRVFWNRLVGVFHFSMFPMVSIFSKPSPFSPILICGTLVLYEIFSCAFINSPCLMAGQWTFGRTCNKSLVKVQWTTHANKADYPRRISMTWHKLWQQYGETPREGLLSPKYL